MYCCGWIISRAAHAPAIFIIHPLTTQYGGRNVRPMSMDSGGALRTLMGPTAVSNRMEKIFEGELRPGEHPVWCEQPSPDSLARKSLPTLLFGIPFFGFAVFWTYGASGGFDHSANHWNSIALLFPFLWGGMFIIIGAGLLLSPVWAYWKALQTVYAITDQRAIIITATWRKRTVFSFTGQQLSEVHRVENNNGSGDIVFHRQARSGRRGDYYHDIGFLGIEHVRDVEIKLQKLRDNGAGA